MQGHFLSTCRIFRVTVRGPVAGAHFVSRCCKKPVGVRCVDTEKAEGTARSRLVARQFKPRRGVHQLEGFVCASMPPVELVKFFIVRDARRRSIGNVRKVMLMDIGKAHLYVSNG